MVGSFLVTFLSIDLGTFIAQLSTPDSFTAKTVTAFAKFIEYFKDKDYYRAYATLVGSAKTNEIWQDKIDKDIEGILTVDATKVFGLCESSLLPKKYYVAALKYIFELSKILVVKLVRSQQLTSLYKATKFNELKDTANKLNTAAESLITGFNSIFTSSGYDVTVEDAWFANFTEEKVTKAIEENFNVIKKALEDFVNELDILDALLADSGMEAIESEHLEAFSAMCKTLLLEDRLLAQIKEFDEDNNFYYNLTVEDSLAIEFNESSSLTIYSTK